MKGLGKLKRQHVVRELQAPDDASSRGDNPFVAPDLPPAILGTPPAGAKSRAEVIIPPYATMAAGDRIVMAWENRLFALPPVSAEQVGSPLTVTIHEPLRGLAGMRDVRIAWQCHDAEGRWLRWAPATYAPLRCTGPFAPTPWLEDTVEDAGRLFRAMNVTWPEVMIRVEGHYAKLGDRVTLRCESITAAGKIDIWSSPPTRLARDGQTLDFHVPSAVFKRATGGSCVLGYTIYGSRAAPRESLRRRIEVLGTPASLPAPTIQQVEDAVLDPSLATGGASVVVPKWPGASDDDECHLEWAGTTAEGEQGSYTDTASGRDVSISASLTFPVPPGEITWLDGGVLRVRYRVESFVQVETFDKPRREHLHTLVSEWLELRVQKMSDPPVFVTDDLNGMKYRRFDHLKRAYITFSPALGEWSIRGGHDGILPFHDGTFLCSSDDRAALRIEFIQPCSTVRFGYGANGHGGNGSHLHVDIYDEHGNAIGEATYVVPLTGLPGLWVHLYAKDYGDRIGAIVVRKDTAGSGARITAQIDNFTLSW
ncbi:MAG TPA: hypothetical protein VGN46_13605 [Luteibacter sp.]|uniref:hypothetical protein n=1 Tax=Luteibacter sp. TaxID=1886636 RepID=UPI002F3EBDAB